jgi:hypothetical protein
LIIAIDFDGTCVTHEYPEIGEDIGAVPVLKELAGKGHSLILWTMRGGTCKDKAVNWFMGNRIPLYGINTNPTQSEWTDSPKAYAQLYIDDAALGVPLIEGKAKRPYVDWAEIRKILTKSGVL